MDYNTGYSSTSSTGINPVVTVVYYLILIVVLVAGWKVFSKAGKPGWAIIIPFYNIYVLLKIVGRPGWWLILYFIPIVNIIIHLIVSLDLAKSFGQGGAFGVFLLWLLPFIGYPVLGFGKSTYKGAKAK